MLRLVKIEYLKLKSNRALWILLGLYFVAIASVAFGAGEFLDFLTKQGADFRGINPSLLPIYDWEDIWHNLAFIAWFFSLFPAFLLVISVCNEFSYKTHRQNIIDGLSRTEFFFSKLSFAAFLSLVSSVWIFLLGLILGAINSESGIEAFGSGMIFLVGHALEVFMFFLFAILVALVIRRSGITIVLLLLYVVLEWSVSMFLTYNYPSWTVLLPLDTITSVVRNPLTKYVLMETPDYIDIADLARAGIWGSLITLGIFRILKKKDF